MKSPHSPDNKRTPTKKLKTARGRSNASQRWLNRQINDPYVNAARDQGYRSRAAFKLIQMNEKFHFIHKNSRVLDLGAAPGGWTQVARELGAKHIVGIDLLHIDPIPGVEFIQQDFMDDDVPEKLRTLLDGKADVVMSDMAPNTTGHAATDHLRIMALAETALYFAEEVLAPGGTFIAKVLAGGTEKDLLNRLKTNFKIVRHVKPPASRKESRELYVLAQGFKSEED